MVEKKRINIGTVGHVDHGKTTLSSAITKVCSNDPEVKQKIGATPIYNEMVDDKSHGKYLSYSEIDNAPEEKARGITINARTVEVETRKYRYSLVDCPGHADFIKNMIVGAQNLDVALLVVDATQGVQIQTNEHLRLIRSLGVPNVILVLTKCGRVEGAEAVDLEVIELSQEVALESIKKVGYGDVPCVKVSALEALNGDPKWMLSILELMKTVEDNIHDIKRDLTSPGKMLVETIHNIPGRGKVLAGPISRGIFKVGQKVKIVVLSTGNIVDSEIISMEAFKKAIPEAKAGDNIGFLLRNVPNEIARGDKVVAQDNNDILVEACVAEIALLTTQEGGRASPIFEGYRPQMYYETTDVTVKLKEDEKLASFSGSAKPGDVITSLFVLEKKQPLEINTRFTLREGGKTIAAGKVVRLVKDYIDSDEIRSRVDTGRGGANDVKKAGVKVK
jgi:elongation factor Tu